ncbi:hypothetical protein [Salinisphaera sp. Q1T1-3]|uniref:hypothetical protein n=1 Tax=Salinisphaera sp. Q1T1-3 TaxID=2321229 RepID=UPI000E71AF94|nr:hypothetical protein [Salinisphaera sp. Q1T1-3]RJS94161.1 hypothetical protein D3260_06270 [Salinisphaera sp. Q1T1-3]
MSEERELEDSTLSGPLTSGRRKVEIQIYRLKGDQAWTLEVVDEYNNSTVWDETFTSDSAALADAKKAILENTIGAFIGPEDGKPTNDWR